MVSLLDVISSGFGRGSATLCSKRLQGVYSERISQGQEITKDRERKDAKTAKKRKENAIVTGLFQSISLSWRFFARFASLR